MALVLLIIPWVGHSFVKAIELLLRENQEREVVASARAVATALQDRPGMLPRREAETADGQSTPGSQELQLLLAGLARSGLRIWVVDNKLRLVALAGSLDVPDAAAAAPTFGVLERMTQAALRPLFGRIMPAPSAPQEEVIPNDVVFGGRALERALDGSAAWGRRPGSQARSVILSAAHPIWVGETVVGAVVVEENTDAIVSLANRALQKLVVVTLIAFTAAAVVLLLFASHLSSRLRRLRDEAENAVDARGRTRAVLTGEHARDEIGDLSRSFSAVLARLADYNAYLESLAGRLAHELRTPIAVVRSSMDNLKLQPLPAEADVYLGRADGGLSRLETILTRMAEATRLEQMVREDEREHFDARAVLAGCVSGYQSAYPAVQFYLSMPEQPVALLGSPDLFAQMLDKLAANAADFTAGPDAIRVTLERRADAAVLRFDNSGPLLPAEMQGRLFESMVSVRKERAGSSPHLGLGLYMVRLIAEFHGGHVRAMNRADGSGVIFEARFALPAAAISRA